MRRHTEGKNGCRPPGRIIYRHHPERLIYHKILGRPPDTGGRGKEDHEEKRKVQGQQAQKESDKAWKVKDWIKSAKR